MEDNKTKSTIYDVAKEAGVSLATVSRVLNGSKKVAENRKIKVLEAIKKLEFIPDKFAHGLASKTSNSIGVIVPSANYVYTANFINGILNATQKLNLAVHILTTSHDKEQVKSTFKRLSQERIDGAIIFDDELLMNSSEILGSIDFPLILINKKINKENIASIKLDFLTAFKKIINAKLDKKSTKKIYFLSIQQSGYMFKEMEDAFIEIHKERGIPCELLPVPDDYNSNYNWFKVFFGKIKRGFFIGYRDSIAASALNAAHDLNLQIPKDIEVISIMGTRYASIIRPSISSLNVDFKKIGEQSVDMLVNLIKGTLKEKNITIKAVYKNRHSTFE